MQGDVEIPSKIKYNHITDDSVPEYIPVTVIFLRGTDCIIEYRKIGLTNDKNSVHIANITVRNIISVPAFQVRVLSGELAMHAPGMLAMTES